MTHRTLLILLVFPFLLVVLCPDDGLAQQRRIYIANDDHTDYVWTANDDAYKTAFLQMLDYYLHQSDSTGVNQSDFQGRFNADGSLWMWTYQKNKSAQEFQRLIDRVRDGHITIPLQTLVLCYGAMPAEAVIRSMYYPGRIGREFSIAFELVCAMEDQTFPYGLPSLWAGAGAKYSWKGVCGCATHVTGLTDRGREIYRAVGPDGRSVLMKWHSWTGWYGSGGYAEARDPSAAVDFATSDATFLSRYPFADVVGLFGKGGDNFATYTNEFLTTAQAKSTESRRVIVSNELDFFRDFEVSSPPNSVPSFSGGFGNEWELYCATMAEVTASVKRAVEGLRSAEALATCVSLVDPAFMSSRSQSADSAFMNMGLYYEHNWTADGPASWERPAYQRKTASQIVGYVNSLSSDAAAALAGLVQNPGGSRFYVFNPLGWARTDVADITSSISPPFRVIDVSTGQEVRSQLVTRNAQQSIRVLAEDVPSVGYRVYEIQAIAGNFTDPAATFSNGNTTFENGRYKVTVDGHGAITSAIDKLDGDRQLVLAGYSMNDIGSGSGTAVPENVGPVSATIAVDAGGVPSHRSMITLYNTIDRIDIENEVTSNFGDAVTSYEFSFNLSGHTVHHEEIGAIATAKPKSQGGSYSDALGRYDYLTMNHFVDLSDAQHGVTLSNWDSPFFRLGNSSYSTLDAATPQLKALIGGRIDPNLGIYNQNGDSYFKNRYALRSHGAYDQANAMRMALEHQNPFVTAYLTAGSGVYPATNFSFVSVSDPHTILWALKPAEEGISQGVIARVWNVDDALHSLDMTLNSGALISAQRATHIETNTTPVSMNGSTISDELPGQWMQTYKLLTDGMLPIQLVSWTAHPTPQGRVEMNWKTLSEINNYGFEVQRRGRGQQQGQWVQLGFVRGHGTTTEPQEYSFVDSTVSAGQWSYRLKQTDLDSQFRFSPEILVDVLTGVDDDAVPRRYALFQNYPNPFNPSCRLKFDLPRTSFVTLKVYDVLGREVATVVNEERQAGRYEIQFDANLSGTGAQSKSGLASGVYLYRLQASAQSKQAPMESAQTATFTASGKMILLK